MRSRINPISRKPRVKVGITIGDPSGIGPAITLKAVNKLKGLADFVIIGDSWVLDRLQATGYRLQAKLIDLHNVAHKSFRFGKMKAEYGRASIEYLDKALELIRKKEIDCLVTCPISKEAINKAGFRYGGHTEYLCANTDTKDCVMMLANNDLRFSLATRHIPLKNVPFKVTGEGLVKNITMTYHALKKLFGLRYPRIVVCGLNPHASDNGVLGQEEDKVIKPALKIMRKRIKCLDGPLSADVAIHKANSGLYDAVIAMYHDQALIPLKLLGNDSGVNITLGLPFIRTSPLHGTAFDIASKPESANPASIIAAIKLAVKCASNLKKA